MRFDDLWGNMMARVFLCLVCAGCMGGGGSYMVDSGMADGGFAQPAVDPSFADVQLVDTSMLADAASGRDDHTLLSPDAAPRLDGCEGAPAVLEGSANIGNADHVRQIACYQVIAGDLQIDGFSVSEIVLPALTSVKGLYVRGFRVPVEISLPALRIVDEHVNVSFNASSVHLAMPALASVRGSVVFNENDAHTTLEAPALSTANEVSITSNTSFAALILPALTGAGNIGIRNNSVLTDIELPLLARSSSMVVIRENPLLAHLEFPALSSIQEGLKIIGNNRLTAIDLTAIESANTVMITENANLTDIHMPRLEFVSTSLAIAANPELTGVEFVTLSISGHVKIWLNRGLASIDMPALTTIVGHLDIHDNAALNRLSLPLLTSVMFNQTIRDNLALCQSIVDAIVARLRDHGWDGDAEIGGNRHGC